MSVPTTVLNSVPQTEQLGQLIYRRDELLRAAQRNRVGAQQRASDILTMMAEGTVAEDYDVDTDHRVVALLRGADVWELEAASMQDQIDQLNSQMAAMARPAKAPVRGPSRRKGEA